MPANKTIEYTTTKVDVLYDSTGLPQPGYPITRVHKTAGRKFLNVVTVNNHNERPWSNYQYVVSEVNGGARPNYRYSATLVDPGGGLPSYWKSYYQGVIWSPTYYSVDDTSPEPTGFDDVDDIALSKLAASLADERTQWNAAVALGEGRETALHLAHTATRLYRGFNSFKKLRLREAYHHLMGHDLHKSHERAYRSVWQRVRSWKREDGPGSQSKLKDIESAWMEFSFAWVPLLGDIDSAARYFAEKRIKTVQPCIRVSRWHARETTTETIIGTGTEARFREVVKTSRKVRYTYMVRPTWLRQPSTLDELGFTDPWSVAWELLPLSFVVDYFINVGQVLQSLHEFQHWQVDRGIKASMTKVEKSYVLKAQTTAKTVTGATANIWTFPPQRFYRSYARRQVLTSLPTALPLRVKVANPFDLKTGPLATVAILLRWAFTQPSPKRRN